MLQAQADKPQTTTIQYVGSENAFSIYVNSAEMGPSDWDVRMKLGEIVGRADDERAPSKKSKNHCYVTCPRESNVRSFADRPHLRRKIRKARPSQNTDRRNAYSVASRTIRAAAWLASSSRWIFLKWRPNSTSSAFLLPSRVGVADATRNSPSSGHDEHTPATGMLPNTFVITSCGLFMPQVSHTTVQKRYPVDFKLYHYPTKFP